jgi:hypothetical protein
MTSKRDLSLFSIIADTSPVNLSSFTGDITHEGALHFSHSNISCAPYEEHLDAEYYLSECRPLQAFSYVLQNNPVKDILLTSPPNLPSDLKDSLIRTARSAALNNIMNASILSSCTTFLHLFGIETETLRVDVAAALRIIKYTLDTSAISMFNARLLYSHTIYNYYVNHLFSTGTHELSVVDKITLMFLDFPVDEMSSSSPSVMMALEILGEASRYLVNKPTSEDDDSTVGM